ncbi:uncharacterized protein CLUP02_02712 [Colletotrichum lupini]|uniref:Uncharacterized protein n=1 Tax=Colletotrichum lupini TaxID=145971 RepID=A0A9Q8SHV0_9PEZI|nr:uncharacterized protein CLUP02_02712 [Colletotrichum lupini]UQC77245.1 hypothetical protein CLUP02_02712 [Colletotrichum lupini]
MSRFCFACAGKPAASPECWEMRKRRQHHASAVYFFNSVANTLGAPWFMSSSSLSPLSIALVLVNVSSRLLTSPHSPFHWRLSEESYGLRPLELLIGPGFGRASVNWGFLFLAICDPKDKKKHVLGHSENSRLRHLDRDSRDRGCIAYESISIQYTTKGGQTFSAHQDRQNFPSDFPFSSASSANGLHASFTLLFLHAQSQIALLEPLLTPILERHWALASSRGDESLLKVKQVNCILCQSNLWEHASKARMRRVLDVLWMSTAVRRILIPHEMKVVGPIGTLPFGVRTLMFKLVPAEAPRPSNSLSPRLNLGTTRLQHLFASSEHAMGVKWSLQQVVHQRKGVNHAGSNECWMVSMYIFSSCSQVLFGWFSTTRSEPKQKWAIVLLSRFLLPNLYGRPCCPRCHNTSDQTGPDGRIIVMWILDEAFSCLLTQKVLLELPDNDAAGVYPSCP